MAEDKKKVEGEYLTYQGKPLVREGNTIIYGDLNHDPCVLVLEIMAYKEEGGEQVPAKVIIDIVDSKDPNKILQHGQKESLHDAFSLGLTWLDLKLKKSEMQE
ncbi:MAG: hypothetical protein J6B09_07395 [Clostridia bacterium]|nr:hypothetical protein [Clostridia bacterium]MBQ8717056.1 hypothetical protein [Clostridia bacterium]